jgi:Tfp pilus assembly protein PilV
MRRNKHAFALYEVLIGVTIFAVGVLSLGWSVQNCLNASSIGAEDERVRQILADRMAEVQAMPGVPDASKQIKVDTGYGEIALVQRVAPAPLKGENDSVLNGMHLVTLTAEWKRHGVAQIHRIQFYVFRNG